MALALCCAPLLLLPLSFVAGGIVPVLLLLAFALLCLAYSLPGIALKHTFLQFLVPPLCAGILFAQAILLSGAISLPVMCLLSIVVVNHLILEALHCLHDAEVAGENGLKQRVAATVLRSSPWATAVLSACFAFVHPVFLAGLLFSIVRIACLRSVVPGWADYPRLRKVFNPLLPTYEYLFYAGAGLAGVFA